MFTFFTPLLCGLNLFIALRFDVKILCDYFMLLLNNQFLFDSVNNQIQNDYQNFVYIKNFLEVGGEEGV